MENSLPALFTRILQTYGSAIAPIAYSGKTLLENKRHSGSRVKFTKGETKFIEQALEAIEKKCVHDGINFSRAQIKEILRSRDAGETIEFETVGPYLADYIADGGRMTLSNLLPEDKVGLALAGVLREIFPKGRLVSFCDDYNSLSAHNRCGGGKAGAAQFGREAVKNFKHSLVDLMMEVGALSAASTHGEDYLLIDESSRQYDAPLLVDMLEQRGHIRRNGQEIVFYNDLAENPLYREFRLRTGGGHWLCEALDASAFLRPHNRYITHLVVLPDYMKSQQDRVWEILALLGIQPYRYHNIFYPADAEPEAATLAVRELFTTAVA